MTFVKGKSGNPHGRPSGRQAFSDRARRFLEEYSIEALIGLTKDREAFGRLAVIDGMIVNRLVSALTKGGGADMDRILDRVIGKPAQETHLISNVTLADLVAGSFEQDELVES